MKTIVYMLLVLAMFGVGFVAGTAHKVYTLQQRVMARVATGTPSVCDVCVLMELAAPAPTPSDTYRLHE